MMPKKALTLLVVSSLCFMHVSAFGKTLSDSDIKHNQKTSQLGKGASESSTAGISASMVGWGLGLTAAIAILAGVLKQSKADSSHAEPSSTSPSHSGKSPII